MTEGLIGESSQWRHVLSTVLSWVALASIVVAVPAVSDRSGWIAAFSLGPWTWFAGPQFPRLRSNR